MRIVLILTAIALIGGAGAIACQRHWLPPRHEPVAQGQPAAAATDRDRH